MKEHKKKFRLALEQDNAKFSLLSSSRVGCHSEMQGDPVVTDLFQCTQEKFFAVVSLKKKTSLTKLLS